VRVLGEEPGLGLPNQHTKACPRFQTLHCWCPSATGPGQPHQSDCSHYRKIVPCGACGKALRFMEASTDTWMCEDEGCLLHGAQQHSKQSTYAGVSKFGDKFFGKFFGHGLPYAKVPSFGIVGYKLSDATLQAKAYATEWAEAHTVPEVFLPVLPLCTCDHRFGAIPHATDCPAFSTSIQCTCAAKSGVGHAAFCPLGEKSDETVDAPDPSEYPAGRNFRTAGATMIGRKLARDEFEHEGILYRRYDDGRIGYYRVTPLFKPVLQIGKYYRVKSDALADFPLRLARTPGGKYYWTLARDRRISLVDDGGDR
jgi:hypothetical protein